MVRLMHGARRSLASGSEPNLSGPLRRADRALEPSNGAFKRGCASQWGLRGLYEVVSAAPPNIVGSLIRRRRLSETQLRIRP